MINAQALISCVFTLHVISNKINSNLTQGNNSNNNYFINHFQFFLK